MSKPSFSLATVKTVFERIRFELQPENRKTLFRRLKRSSRFQYWKLLRTPGGGKTIAGGFAFGFALEMILPITAYTAYVLMLPILRYRNLFSTAIIGNAVAKVTLLPLLLIPIGIRFGHHLFFPLLQHVAHHTIWHRVLGYVSTVIGLSIFAVGIGFVAYGIVYFLYSQHKNRRLARRKALKLG